jgi:hypothetical protein
LREADIGTGGHRCCVVGRHQCIKIGITQYAAGDALRSLCARVANRTLRTDRALRTCGARSTHGTLGTCGTNITRRALGTRRALRTDGTGST